MMGSAVCSSDSSISLREELLPYAAEQLGCTFEAPFHNAPGYTIIRHPLNGKWAGIIMDIPARYIGCGGDEIIDVVNVKLDPFLVASLKHGDGYAPAWHMNKEHWLTVCLDGSVPFDNVCALLEMSYSLVAPKRRKNQ